MIPFLFIGLLVILPVNVYYDAVFHGYFTGTFLSFYLGPYFTKFFPFDLNFSATYFADSNQGIYLWYLFWLFVFFLITVYLFKWFAKEQNRNRLSKLYYGLIFITLYIFVAIFIVFLISHLINRDYELVIQIAEFAIIGSGTLTILTFTYALAKTAGCIRTFLRFLFKSS